MALYTINQESIRFVYMIKRIFSSLLVITIMLAIASCADDDTFSSSTSNQFSFSTDTLRMDTVFSNVGSSTYKFWVYNHSNDGIRLTQVRLLHGNQTGLRVNVDGSYLDNSLGSAISNLEVRKGDSLQVFVELTATENNQDTPQLISDDLVFQMESGAVQKVNIRGYAWDAQLIDSLIVGNDMVLDSSKPYVIHNRIEVDSGKVLSINYPAKLYFHDSAGIDVYGTLRINADTDSPEGDVVLRGDRLDHMFSYLPYDRVSGQWRGIHLMSSSSQNILNCADVHSSTYGILCDSAAYHSNLFRLLVNRSTIHNCKGTGIEAYCSNIQIQNSQISNTLGDCIAIYGGSLFMNYCTVAQFYPLNADRGAAFRYANYSGTILYPNIEGFAIYNSILTGYDEDVVMVSGKNKTDTIPMYVNHSLMRTPKVDNESNFIQVIWETKDSLIRGDAHFQTVDINNMIYDFHLKEESPAHKAAGDQHSITVDRLGIARTDSTDMGCFQFVANQEQ